MNRYGKMILASGCLSIFTLLTFFEACVPSKDKNQVPVSLPQTPVTFEGSSACQSCHPKEYKDWLLSDHFLAMQEAHDSTVLGDFSNITFAADGVTNRFFRKDGKYYINTQGDDGKNHDYEIRYTFGYFPLQQYLIEFPRGRLQPARASWDSRKKKWFHQYPGQKLHPHDWLHWTGNGQNWNTMCASCHSTNLRKNYDFVSDSYDTKWTDINVGCESCHGPASSHVALARSADYKIRGQKNTGLHYSNDTTSSQQLTQCASCHARKSDISQDITYSAELLDDMIPQVISNEFYFPDGQIREEDYEFGSFAQSRMFHQNVRCSNCHNPHSGKLLKTGNDLCMSCHQPKYNTKQHHFHAVNTKGAQCINCHMPVKTFMGNDSRRDHSFRVPRPDQSVSFGTPNTCNTCHKEKSSAWAATAIRKWYGPARAHHFSDDLLPGSELIDKSEMHLIKLLKDTLAPAIARATAAGYLGNIVTRSAGNALVTALRDNNAMVRYYTVRALTKFSPDFWLLAAAPALSDKVRAVRIAAADLYHQLPRESIPASILNAYTNADAGNRKYLQYQTDFAIGNVMLADYELQGGDHLNAITHYVRGLSKDSLMNYARLNLSAAYNSLGRNQESLKVLKDAAAIDPANDRTYYNLGLLYYELNDIKAALDNFSKSVRLNSTNPGLYYNYGLLLQQQEKVNEAEQILLKGFALDPHAANINYALSYLYVQLNLLQQARKHGQILQELDPQNPEYADLFRRLGL